MHKEYTSSKETTLKQNGMLISPGTGGMNKSGAEYYEVMVVVIMGECIGTSVVVKRT
jgi:hypothetical protein